MKKISILFLIAACFFSGCRSSGPKTPKTYVHTVHEYHNEYENGLLVRTVVYLARPDSGTAQDDFTAAVGEKPKSRLERQQEHLYFYDAGGELVRKEISSYSFSGLPGLPDMFSRIVYTSRTEEEETNYQGFRHYSYSEYDEFDRLVRYTYRYTPDMDSEGFEKEDYEEFYAYGPDGEITQEVYIDNLTGKRSETRYFDNPVPAGEAVSPDAVVVIFTESTDGDTLVTHRTSNGSPDGFSKKIDRPDYLLEVTYDNAGKITSREEAFSRGRDSLRVMVFAEAGTVDSTFFRDGLMEKFVLSMPGHRRTERYEYDSLGNISREETIGIYLE